MVHKHGGDIYTYEGVKDFSANINFHGMPKTVRAAAIDAVDRSIHYPDPECRALRLALAVRENSEVPKGRIRPEQIVCGNGAAEVMFALAASWHPERALVAAPSFFEYEQAFGAFGCELERYALKEEKGFALDEGFLEAAEAFASGPGRRAMILGNPNNPSGRLIGRDILEPLLKLCRLQKVLLVLDESFWDFLDEEDRARTVSGAAYLQEHPFVFVIRSFTKMYALPGLRFGYGLSGNAELLEGLRRVLQPWNVSVVAQEAARAAALELPFAKETAREIRRYREELSRGLEEAGLRVYPSDTNFLLFRGPKQLDEFCLDQGILIRSCRNFPGLSDTEEEGFFRVCVRSREENQELLEVLQTISGRWQR